MKKRTVYFVKLTIVIVHSRCSPLAAVTRYLLGLDQSPGTPKAGDPSLGVILAAVDKVTITPILFTEHFSHSDAGKDPSLAAGTDTSRLTVLASLSIINYYSKIVFI